MMNKFQIIISLQAKKDIKVFYNHICYEYKQPKTANENRRRLYERIDQLSWLADVVGCNDYVQNMFGVDARHIVYKKMAIIYVIRRNIVYVKRVIASSMIH
jgi:hypothetical protein